jgi:hypothetical protein
LLNGFCAFVVLKNRRNIALIRIRDEVAVFVGKGNVVSS